VTNDHLKGTGSNGWLALLGGGEFSRGETLEADRAWLDQTQPGPVVFLPAASGSVDYGRHFADYLQKEHSREVRTVPIYRRRDARREKNCRIISEASGVYVGGGLVDRLLDVLEGSPALDALQQHLESGGMVAAMASAAQGAGEVTRSWLRGESLKGLGWLPETAVEANFNSSSDRRLRGLMGEPGVRHGLGLCAGAALLVGPDGRLETVGEVFLLDGPEGKLVPLH
jgi:cyanophycinase-like exopeptidase